MRFEHDTYDIDVYSLCESVYYSCNNDEYDYVLECVNNWIYNDYNDNLLLEDIILNEISSTKIYKVLADKFVKTFPEYASSREDFYNKVGYKPANNGIMQYWDKDENEWVPFENADPYYDDNGTNFAEKISKVFRRNTSKDKRLQSFLRYANALLNVNSSKNFLRGSTRNFYPETQVAGKPFKIAKEELKAKAEENNTQHNSPYLLFKIADSEFSKNVKKRIKDYRYDGYTVHAHKAGKNSIEERPSFEKRRPHTRKTAEEQPTPPPPPKQEKPSQTPPKSNPILLNAQKKKDESQANMQKIVDNISQTSQQQEPTLKPGTAATDQSGRKVETNTQHRETQPNTPPKKVSLIRQIPKKKRTNTPLEDNKGQPAETPNTTPQQEPPLKPGTAATDQPGRKVETNTQHRETQPNTPPKSNTPVVASNGNTPSRLSRATTWMKNNKVKGGLGVVAAGAAIGGSIYAYKRFKNRPKSVIAKRIQALRGIYHKFMINAQRNPKKADLFKRVAAKILSVIDKLLHYLQNKADGR